MAALLPALITGPKRMIYTVCTGRKVRCVTGDITALHAASGVVAWMLPLSLGVQSMHSCRAS